MFNAVVELEFDHDQAFYAYDDNRIVSLFDTFLNNFLLSSGEPKPVQQEERAGGSGRGAERAHVALSAAAEDFPAVDSAATNYGRHGLVDVVVVRLQVRGVALCIHFPGHF